MPDVRCARVHTASLRRTIHKGTRQRLILIVGCDLIYDTGHKAPFHCSKTSAWRQCFVKQDQLLVQSMRAIRENCVSKCKMVCIIGPLDIVKSFSNIE